MGRLTWDVIEQADLRYGGVRNPQTPGKRRNETRQQWRVRVQNQRNGQQVRERTGYIRIEVSLMLKMPETVEHKFITSAHSHQGLETHCYKPIQKI